MGKTLTIHARAKINWTLDIVGCRADGYHLMDMLMQPISLHDTLTLCEADSLTLTCEGNGAPAEARSNLVWRAAEALQAATGCAHGVDMRLIKRVPVGSGLGGGSADAAAALHGLNRLWGTGLSQERLEKIGLEIGADVPFCLRGGLCRVQGIGEKLLPQGEGPVWPLVVVQPCDGLSTGEIFRRWQAREKPPVRTDETLRALLSHELSLLPGRPGNSLEAVSAALRPEIGEAEEALRALGAVCAQMSGSGSAVYGVFAEAGQAELAASALSQRWPKTFACATVNTPFEYDQL